MNVVMIIPTGLGCAIGGDAGDASPAAKLLAACCDNLIIHPNVVNASDINEMTENMWYVEGSMLNRFLFGSYNLRRPHHNRILTVANPPITDDTINAVSAARATIGANIEVLELSEPLRMVATMKDGVASGDVYGLEPMLKDIKAHNFDALAVHTPIEVHRDIALSYFRNGGVNPWGGVEAKVSKLIADQIRKPTAHAPVETVTEDDRELYFIFQNERIKPRMAAEVISNCYLHCVLKGLHRAPRPSKGGLSYEDIDFMVSPDGCWGKPHDICFHHKTEMIFVKENTVAVPVERPLPLMWTVVDNYLEAAGHIMAARAGVDVAAVRARLSETTVRTK
jgi:hypothetical protein